MNGNRFRLDGLGIIDAMTEQSLSRLQIVNMLNHLWNDNQEYLKTIREKNCKEIQGETVKSVKCEVFSFNTNCAKLYQIRSVSPNGVIRIGSKNRKVKWRMKDVREINNELPPRDEFNREEYNKLRNKYHTRNWYGDDVLGRIIYNIYNGTFGEYI